MKIVIVTPAAASARTGNRHTAQRYARFLRSGGHDVRILTQWNGEPVDLMIALHARKSHAAMARYRAAHPDAPLVLVLTGTDLYRDLADDRDAQASLDLATLIVTLQDRGIDELAARHRRKVRAIYQSAQVARVAAPPRRKFRVCVVGHLRDEKDPFRAALAAALLPDAARLEVVQLGDALSTDMASAARDFAARDERYRWLGGVPHWKALDWLARSHVLVVSSRMEGGANVICEAARIGTPVLASAIAGNVGMLGKTYPGYYPLADERALARLIERAMTDGTFYRRLQKALAARRHLFVPSAERRGVVAVVKEATRLARR